MYLLTKTEIERLISSSKLELPSINISLDLGLTQELIKIEKQNFILPDKSAITAKELTKFKLKERIVYYIHENQLNKFIFYSPTKRISYKLMPTKGWPTLTLSSTPMHRYTYIDPKEDTIRKMHVIAPILGKVLDTCTGLGYTAIMSSKKAESVITFEKDSNIIEIAKNNPYSKELFESKNIKIKNEDISIAIKKLKDNIFDRIIHDPPTIKIAGELYSNNFYKELYRVMKPGAIGYIYIPRPGITKNKQGLEKPIMKRLQEIGFKTEYNESSQGIKAIKP